MLELPAVFVAEGVIRVIMTFVAGEIGMMGGGVVIGVTTIHDFTIDNCVGALSVHETIIVVYLFVFQLKIVKKIE